MLNHEGENPLTEVSIQLIDYTKLRQLPIADLFPEFPVSAQAWTEFRKTRDLEGEIGRLREQAIQRFHIPRSQKEVGRMLTRFQIPDSFTEQDIGITIISSEGVFEERIVFRKFIDKWKVGFRVTRVTDGGQRETMFELIDPEIEFPKG